MVCTSCGSQQTPGARFCRQCGQHLQQSPSSGPQPWTPLSYPAGYGSAVLPERRTRVQNNVQALGILWCVYGVYRVMAGFIAAFAMHQLALVGGSSGDFPPFVVDMLGGLAPTVILASVVMSALALVAGIGLLNRKPWARTLSLVLAILALIKLPVGTALGIYTLWVMASGAAAVEWDEIKQQG